MREIIVNEPGHLVFDGYIDDESVPAERILRTIHGDMHVEIYENKTMEDTTVGSYDEEFGGYISFFSTAIIDLRYRVIATLDTTEKRDVALDRIAALENDLEQRDAVHRAARALRDANTYNTEAFPKSV